MEPLAQPEERTAAIFQQIGNSLANVKKRDRGR